VGICYQWRVLQSRNARRNRLEGDKMAYIIKADGTVQEVQPKNGRYFTLEEQQKAVDGYIEYVYAKQLKTNGIIQAVKLSDNGEVVETISIKVPPDAHMVVNEDVRGHNEQINEIATAIYINPYFPYIRGDVLLCKRSEVR
jgi:hypothetical protein